ncbi:head-tail connector protein [Klebsiella michiganensis]|nr:head-tail connector protein [Klebsiella michiganensis]MDV5345188.1 head-tail connector protein [Klebsiella michiganensis]MDV5445640.1 head-tail connector protein [Klebsiella michiganensis]
MKTSIINGSEVSRLSVAIHPDGLVIEDDIKLALMLLVSHWYENREPVSGDSVNTIPFGVKAILEQHRKVPGT